MFPDSMPALTPALTLSAHAFTLVPAFLVGAVGWTLAEYVLHRFLMHAMKGRGMPSREHLTHHAQRDYYAGTPEKALFSVVVSVIMVPVFAVLVGLPVAVALQAGFIVAYLTYEWLHRRAHTHPPRGRYGRWLRRSHFHHHFGRPLENHGVSTPLWDIVFGTRVEPGVIRVPRRLAMRWLLLPNGELDPAWAADYVLVGRRPEAAEVPSFDAADHDAAFSNAAPSD